MKSKRPWKKHARIERVEHRSGDVKFNVWQRNPYSSSSQGYLMETFETLTQSEAFLDNWYADWWPKQVKSTKSV